MGFQKDEKGNMAPLLLVATVFVIVIASFGVDQSLAYGAKASQENLLEQMRLTCMDNAFALKVKSSENPGKDIASEAFQVAREQGFQGPITVWFYEKPWYEVSEASRFWVIGFQLEENAPTIFARGWGLYSLPVASWKVVTAEPYAASQVWRPKKLVCGRFVCPEGARANEIKFESFTKLDTFPEQIKRAAGY